MLPFFRVNNFHARVASPQLMNVLLCKEKLLVENENSFTRNEKLLGKNEKSLTKNEKLPVENENSFTENEKLLGRNENSALANLVGNLSRFIAFIIILEKWGRRFYNGVQRFSITRTCRLSCVCRRSGNHHFVSLQQITGAA